MAAIATQTNSNNGKTSLATKLCLKTVNILVFVKTVVNDGAITSVKHDPRKDKNAPVAEFWANFSKKCQKPKKTQSQTHSPNSQMSTRSTQQLPKAMTRNLSTI